MDAIPMVLDKNDKHALRKTANFFAVNDAKLYYTSSEFLAS